MTKKTARTHDRAARAGDWLEVHVIGGGPSRHGQVLEVLGRPGHEHYRVRWDEEHESIHFPGGGTVVARRVSPPRARRSGSRRAAAQ